MRLSNFFQPSAGRAPARAIAARLALVCLAACSVGALTTACGNGFEDLVDGDSIADTHTSVKPRVVLDGLVDLSSRTSDGLYIEEVFLHAPTVQLQDGQTPIDNVLDSDPFTQSSLFFHYSLYQGGAAGIAVGGDRHWDLRRANTLADPRLAFTFAPYTEASADLEALVAAHGCDLTILDGHSAVVQGYVAVESLGSSNYETGNASPVTPKGDGKADEEHAQSAKGKDFAGDGDGAPAAGDGDGAPADIRDLVAAGDGDGAPARGRNNAGDGDGAPAAGDGDGAPAAGDGDGAPAAGDGDGAPAAGDGDGAPAAGDGDGAPAAGDGDGAPAAGDGDGAPAAGDGDGAPAAGDGDGAPADQDEAYAGAEGAKSGKYDDQSMGDRSGVIGFERDGQRLVPFLVVIPIGMTLEVPFDEFADASVSSSTFLPIDLHVDADRLFSAAVMDALELEAEEINDGEGIVLRLEAADTQGVFDVELQERQLKKRPKVAPTVKAPIVR